MARKKPGPADKQPPTATEVWPAELAPPLKPGINVAAKYGGVMKNWFLAELVGKSDAGFRVRIGSELANPDGETTDVGADEVVPMPDRAVFAVGDLVAAHCGDGSLRPSEVRSVSPTHREVAWHRTVAPVTVPLGMLTFQEWLVLCSSGGARPAAAPRQRAAVKPPAPTTAPAPAPGVTVALRYGKEKFAIGRVAKAVDDSFSIEYFTGDRKKAKATDIIPVPVRPVFRTGDTVLAVWSGMRLCPGRITALSPAGYAVEWDDGFAPQIVPLGSLTFRAWAEG